MIKIIFSIIFILLISFNSFGQEEEKIYVHVPEKFEFLKEENRYQLNALTAFLFEKYGFNSLYKKTQPVRIGACNIYRADVHDESNFLTTRLSISLTDCNNEVVFKSEIGKSKEKDYKKSYHEALREAAKSLNGITSELKQTAISNVMQQNDASEEKKSSSEEASQIKELPKDILGDPVISSKEIKASQQAKIDAQNKEVTNFRSYIYREETYYLRDTSVGYELLREGKEEKFATLIKSGGGENFIFSSNDFSGNAFFDSEGNLLVEYLDPDSGELNTVLYSLQN